MTNTQSIYDIIDECWTACVAFATEEGQPFAIPMAHVRKDDSVYFHGSRTSRLMRSLAEGIPCAITWVILDGLVLAKSAFVHSMNYRSVCAYGRGCEVTDSSEKLDALLAMVDKQAPGRSALVRPPNEHELRATTVIRLSLKDAVAKVRAAPPTALPGDDAFSCWTGIIPAHIAIDPALLRQASSR